MSRSHLALLALLFASTVARADNRPTERSTNDRLIIDSLARLHDRGASLFNAGDYPGCYRFFQGSLSTIKLVLPPDIQDEIDRGLSRAEFEIDPTRRALILHELIENVRKKLHPTAGKVEVLPNAKPNSDGLEAPKQPDKSTNDKATPGKPTDSGRPAPVHIGGDPKLSDEPPLAPPTGPVLGAPSIPPIPHPQHQITPEPKPSAPVLPDTPPLDPTPSPSVPALPTSNPKQTKPMTSHEEPSPESLSIPPRPIITSPRPSIDSFNQTKAQPFAAPSSDPTLAPPAKPIATNASSQPAKLHSPKDPSNKSEPATSTSPSLQSKPKIAEPSFDLPLVPLPSGPAPSIPPSQPATPMPAAPSGGLPELTAPPPSTDTKSTTPSAPPLLPPPGK